jgi:hypothetical protein
MSRESLLYVTQLQPQNVNQWDPVNAESALLLRSYLMMHAMFFDRLMVGDSQLINIAYLRSLLWPEESVGGPVPADLSALLARGVLVPALRSSADSLHEVRADLARRGVSYAGSERYVHFIEESAGGTRPIIYEADKVSALFRDQVLATLDSTNTYLRLKDSVRRLAYDYVASQDVLYHIRMRQWMESQVSAGTLTAYHKGKLEDVLAACYLNNVPKSINGSLIDVPLDPRKFWTPIDIRLGRRSAISGSSPSDFVAHSMRPFSVSPHTLGKLPVETLLAIRADPARRPALRRLEEFRRTGEVDAPKLAEELEAFLYSAEEIAYSDARGELREHIRATRRSRRRGRLAIVRDMGLAVAGVSIWGSAGDITGQIATAAGYAGLAVTAWASIHALRNFGDTYRHGYAVGRAVPPEHRLVLAGPNDEVSAHG